MTTLQRRGWVVGLRPGARDEYRRLHENVWPGVQMRMVKAGIENYSIFMYGDLLFSYMEFRGEFEDVQSFIEADEETQRWWKLTEPLQSRLEGTASGDLWARMDEVFRLNTASSIEGNDHGHE
jgi:L-rhamnose mutarotase